MADRERGLYCRVCKRQTMHRAPGSNNVMHVLLVIFTCFLWIIPWIMMSHDKPPLRCSVCGTAAHVCPKCGTVSGNEAPTCPACGARYGARQMDA